MSTKHRLLSLRPCARPLTWAISRRHSGHSPSYSTVSVSEGVVFKSPTVRDGVCKLSDHSSPEVEWSGAEWSRLACMLLFVIRCSGCFLEAHFFVIPLLATPAISICIDHAGIRSTASRIFSQTTLLTLKTLTICPTMIRNCMIIKLYIRASQRTMFCRASLHTCTPHPE